jgi:predicted metal-dependent enzyme (double-stranded beta helix superfamily)
MASISADTQQNQGLEHPARLREYIRAIDGCLDRRLAVPTLIKEVGGLTRDLVADTAWVPAAWRVPSKESYARHLLHRDPRNRYVCLSLVWLPGQGTPVHDHRCWGIMGILENQLEVVNYERLDDGSRPGYAELNETDGFDSCQGATSYILPPFQEIHRIGNRTDRPAVSFHIYGRDIDEVNVFDLTTRTVQSMRIKYYATHCGQQDFII